MLSLIWFLIIGLVIGAIARLIVPGENPMSWWMTLLLGVIGALIGGFVTRSIMGTGSAFWYYIISAAVAVLLVWGYSRYTAGRSGSSGTRP
ncbi:GlsB/YeaQ/YmgE family stress response membrane protein [Rhizohabitans arisaemae]|uniref:GlsB/YeaQ/YmgE family stress response membrane protein n=1 Tax=Rhizohabitans arisaemae TaxID=2720610 RepID=UPI0024B0ECAE|nr:GlsB/YeaQ/YmgE family stress response membrane protein [Rhizohabitans arisaemae]